MAAGDAVDGVADRVVGTPPEAKAGVIGRVGVASRGGRAGVCAGGVAARFTGVLVLAAGIARVGGGNAGGDPEGVLAERGANGAGCASGDASEREGVEAGIAVTELPPDGGGRMNGGGVAGRVAGAGGAPASGMERG